MSYRCPDDAHRCTAHNAMGSRCYAYAIRGGTVCRYHGGLAPQVKLAAEERIRALVHPSLDRIEKTIADSANPQLALAAARDILDRAGFKATDKVEGSGVVTIRIVHEDQPIVALDVPYASLNGHSDS